MRAQVHCALTLVAMCCLIGCMSVVSLAQTTMNASSDLWEGVQATSSRTELEIQLDDGTQLKGRLLTATAGMLRLSRTDEIAEVQRDRVVKIYELSPKPDELRRLVRNAGAAFGFAQGLTIAFTVVAATVVLVILRLAWGYFFSRSGDFAEEL